MLPWFWYRTCKHIKGHIYLYHVSKGIGLGGGVIYHVSIESTLM